MSDMRIADGAAAARRRQSLAPLLAWIMGVTDAIVLVAGGSYFGAFMAGNAALLARAAALPDPAVARVLGALLILFVIAVAGAALIVRAGQAGAMTLLLAQAVLLAAAAQLPDRLGEGAALCAAVAAMGIAHALCGLDEARPAAGLSVTGALVRLGHGLADAIAGGARIGWLPPLLACGIVLVGGVAGALLAIRIGYAAFWMPAAASLFAGLSQAPRRRYAGPARGPGGRRRG